MLHDRGFGSALYGVNARERNPNRREKGPKMKFFVDTADVDAIAELKELGVVDGVTSFFD